MVATTYTDQQGQDRLTGDLDTNSLSQARLNQLEGKFGEYGADFIRWFDSVVFYNRRNSLVKMQAKNTVQAYQNKMNALDNQLLHLKNQLQDKFNNAVANDMVQTAARGLRVSMSNILEKQKESAHNVTQDIEIASSNVEMSKATYKSYQEQAKIKRNAAQRALTTELVESTNKVIYDIIESMFSFSSGGASFGFGNIGANMGKQVMGAQAKSAITGDSSGEQGGNSGAGKVFGQMAMDYIGSIWGS